MVIGDELGLTDKERFAFAWIVDFPIYEKDAETGKIDFEHNPFSMPQGGMEQRKVELKRKVHGHKIRGGLKAINVGGQHEGENA